MKACSYVWGTKGRRPAGLAWAAAVVAGATALTAAPPTAMAQSRLTIAIDEGGAVDVGCDSLDTCSDGVCEGDLVCGTLAGEQRCLFSAEGTTELLCCGTGGVDQCPERDGVRGECTAIGDTGTSVCLYPERVDFCRQVEGTVVLDDAARCLQTPDQQGLTADWSEGDCDGDGQPNGKDCFPCDPERHRCPEPDGGVTDAGPPTDRVDAGEPSQGSFRGDGGVACRAAAGGGPAGGLLPAFVVMGLLLARRRRCGGPGPHPPHSGA